MRTEQTTIEKVKTTYGVPPLYSLFVGIRGAAATIGAEP